jgi:hypothetical protein
MWTLLLNGEKKQDCAGDIWRVRVYAFGGCSGSTRDDAAVSITGVKTVIAYYMHKTLDWISIA